MMQTALDEADLLESGDDFESDAFEDDAFSGDSLDELDELDEGDALDELDAAGDLADEFEDEFAADDGGDGLDEFGDFALDSASGLYVPSAPRLISGPAAVAIAQRLNPFVVEAMDADDADAFFRRIGRGLRRIRQRIGRAASRVGRVVSRGLRVAAPCCAACCRWCNASPDSPVQGRARLGGHRRPADWRQGRPAWCAGAAGGLVPGVGGRLAGALLGGGDGADDDAALDALADMSDAGEVTPTSRCHWRRSRHASPHLASPATFRRRSPRKPRRPSRRCCGGDRRGGSTGRRLRLLRLIARLIRTHLRRTGTARAAAEAFPETARTVAERVLRRARRRPGMYASRRGVALRRLNARRRILRSVPLAAAYPRPRMAAARRRIR